MSMPEYFAIAEAVKQDLDATLSGTNYFCQMPELLRTYTLNVAPENRHDYAFEIYTKSYIKVLTFYLRPSTGVITTASTSSHLPVKVSIGDPAWATKILTNLETRRQPWLVWSL